MNRHSISRREVVAFKTVTNGFSLVEMAIAISVVAVTFIGLIGLLGLGAANDQVSSQQTMATNIAASILADLRCTPNFSTTGKSSRYGLTLPTTGPSNIAAPLSGLTPKTAAAPVLYFDNTATFISPINAATIPSNAAFVANVYLTRITAVGATSTASTPSASLLQYNDMARVVVTWPPQTTTTPAGSVDVISQFLVH